MKRLIAAKLIAKLSESRSITQFFRKLARIKLSEFGDLAALVGCLRIARVSDGMIPSEKAMGKEQLEEERRILFVALSRAKTRLYMTRFLFAYGRKTSPSRFLRDKTVEKAFKLIPVKKAA